MPRPHRVDTPGAIHHVMIRGVERRTIFLDDADRETFLDRFERLVLELGFGCIAWALLPNHVHLVLATGKSPLATLMSRLSAPHAQRFNRRNGRVGHLFQGRYRAELIDDDDGLRRATAYVLGNPVRHRVVAMAALPDFPWTGYSGLTGARPARAFESPARVAQVLAGEDAEELIRATSLEAGVREAALEPDLVVELDALIAASCARHGVPIGSLRLAGRANAAVRAEICGDAVEVLGTSVSQVARTLGVSRATLHRALSPRRRCDGWV